MVFNSMPIWMEPSSHSKTAVASEDDDDNESADDDEDYSFSLSGLPDEENDADPALLSRPLEDSISFSFSIENPFETECDTFGFTESSPLVHCAHAGAFETSSACHNIMAQHDEDEESASLVPFKISGSWRAESSLHHYSRYAESRRSFSFLTDMEHETEHSEELVMHVKGSTIERDSGLCGGGKHAAAHAGGNHDVEVDDDKHVNRGNYQGVLDDQDALCKHGHDDHVNDNNVCTYSGNDADDRDVLGKQAPHDHGKYADHEHAKRAFSDDLTADSIMRFAGEGLLQPWSSSKLSKSCGHQVKQEIGNSQGRIHSSNVSSKSMNYKYPLLSHPPDIKNNFGITAMGTPPTNRMQESFESRPFRGNSFNKRVGSPTHVPLYMPTTRKTSSLFARRVQNAGETLSLLVNAQRHSAAFNEAALSPPSKGSAYSSRYITSSTGSTQSSGYSSSSGKSSTPTSRHLSRNVSLVPARCSLSQRMDGEPHTREHPNAQMHKRGDPSSPLHTKGDPNAYLQRKEDPNAHLHRKGDSNAYLHRKRDPSAPKCEEGDSCKCMHTQAQSKAKTDPFATGHGLMSPSMSPTPRSPMSWRSVLSLQPLNPSHVPLDEWEILGKPSSRSHSQRSRSSSRGSSRRSSLTSAEFLGHSYSNQTSSKKEPNTQKMVKRRRGYWVLNPMQWFRQCRNDKQVVDTSNLVSMEQRRPHAVYK